MRKVGTLVVDADDGADLESLSVAVSGGASAPPGAPDEDDGRLDLSRLSASALGRSAAPEPSRHEGNEPEREVPEREVPERSRAAPPRMDPVAEPRQDVTGTGGGARWLLPLAAGFGLGLAVGAVVFGGSGKPSATGSVASSEPAMVAPPAAVTPAPEPAMPAAAPAAAPPAVEATEPAAPGAPVAAAAPPSTLHRSAATARARARPVTASPAMAAPQAPSVGAQAADDAAPVVRLTPAQDPPPRAEKPASGVETASAGPRSVDELLDEALTGDDPLSVAAAKRKQAAAQSAGLPATPSREEVTRAMAVLLPAIRGCAMGQSGMATAGIVVRNDGRVASVNVTGAPFAGSASGRCMEGVVRRARFPRFTQPTFRIKYPLAIQ